MEAVAVTSTEAQTKIVSTPDETPVTTPLEGSWVSAAKAAQVLKIRRRDVLRLIQQGALERRVEDGKNLYAVPDDEDARNDLRSRVSRLSGTQTGARRHTSVELSPNTHNGPLDQFPAKTGDHEVIELELIDLDDIDEDEDALPAAPAIPHELIATNLELTRLVDVTLQRFNREANEREETFQHLRETMKNLQQVQQCLVAWQHHASSLQRHTLEAQHMTSRALDLADEVLAGRWLRGRRRDTLRERLALMRHDAEHFELDEAP